MSAHPKTNPHLFLLYDDGALTIAPYHAGIAKALTFRAKEMREIGVKRKQRKYDEPEAEEQPEVEESAEAEEQPEVEESAEGEEAAPRKRGMEVARVTVKPFEKIKRPSGHTALTTMQGFRTRVVNYCKAEGIEYTLQDCRGEFPQPRLDLMHGFRFSQKALLSGFLLKNRSGCLSAPTRWGKTCLIINTIRAYPGMTTVVTVPGSDLLEQLYQDIKQAFPDRDVKKIGGGSRVKFMSEDITVCSMDSLDKLDPEPVRLLLMDEPHAASSGARFEELTKFHYCRKLAYGATLSGRFDGRDRMLEGFVGPILAERTYLEAVAEGAIAPIIIFWLDMPFSPFLNGSTRHAMNRVLYENRDLARAISRISNEVIPPDWQTLAFISNQKQAELVLEFMNDEDAKIAMAKLMTTKGRKEMTLEMQNNTLKRCASSTIYAQGVTFHDVRAVINAEGGGASTRAIQKPGRLAEIRPGKRNGPVFDFGLRCVDPYFSRRHSRQSAWKLAEILGWQRKKAYLDKGYTVVDVKTIEELKEKFNEMCL